MSSHLINELMASLSMRRALGPSRASPAAVADCSVAAPEGLDLGPETTASAPDSFGNKVSNGSVVVRGLRAAAFAPSPSSLALAGPGPEAEGKLWYLSAMAKSAATTRQHDPGRRHSALLTSTEGVIGGRFLDIEAVISEVETGGLLSVVIRSSLLGGSTRVLRRPLRDLHLLHKSMTHLVPDATMDYYEIFRPGIESESPELSLASLYKLSTWLRRLCKVVHTHPAALRSDVDIVEDFFLDSQSLVAQEADIAAADEEEARRGGRGRSRTRSASGLTCDTACIRTITRFRPDQLIKCGYLTKLGGEKSGGPGNWRRRFFALTEVLRYFESEDDFRSGRAPKGCVNLVCFYVTSRETISGHFEFTVHSMPFALVCRADRAEERDSWVRTLQNI